MGRRSENWPCVPGQQPLPQCEQDKGDDRGLQEKAGRTGPPLTSMGCSGEGREFQVPWCLHHQRTIMVLTLVKRARQNRFLFRRLKIFGMGPQILKRFYSCTIESILTSCVAAWYGNCSRSDRKALQRVVLTAQYITGAQTSCHPGPI